MDGSGRWTWCKGSHQQPGALVARPTPSWSPRCSVKETLRRRKPLLRGRRPGQRARKRVLAGGKLAVGRPSETLAGWRALKAHVWARARGRCEACGLAGSEAHHVVKRSQGGADTADNVIWLCAVHHRRTDAAYSRGRLVIAPFGKERFLWDIVHAKDKWSTRRVIEATGTTRGWVAALP